MKYIGIKFVDAVPMTADVAKDKGYRVNDSTGDGYEVTYDDGYKSWCPKNVFEKHNFEIKNKVLADSCALMVSPDYKEIIDDIMEDAVLEGAQWADNHPRTP